MPRNITVYFSDGSAHQYNNAPDRLTPDDIERRVRQDYPNKKITRIDGGKSPSNRQEEINACIQRGYDYFDSLGYGKGNYKLSNGRMRDDEVKIRCQRQPKTAF